MIETDHGEVVAEIPTLTIDTGMERISKACGILTGDEVDDGADALKQLVVVHEQERTIIIDHVDSMTRLRLRKPDPNTGSSLQIILDGDSVHGFAIDLAM